MINNTFFDRLPKLTKFSSRKEWEAAIWEILVKRISRVQSAAELKNLFQFLLSPRDQRTITFRALAVSRIKDFKKTSEIVFELWLSRQTLSAIRKSLKEGAYKSSRVRGHVKRRPSDFSLTTIRKRSIPRPTKFGAAIPQRRL